MNKIEFPRLGYDGVSRSKAKIERWYYGEIKDGIGQRLDAIQTEAQWCADEKECAQLIKDHLPVILLASPRDLKRIKTVILTKYPNLFVSKAKGYFNKRILKAFGYKAYRNDVLITLAKWLNIKSCPYCNAQYTLFIDKRARGQYPKGVAKFQFDHFFNKSDAPFLSMSLYNLIPSCASCNLAKHAGDMSMELNPYMTDIASLFDFRVKDPIKLWLGDRTADATQIKLVPTSRNTANLVRELNDTLFLDKQYGRFADVAQKVYDKVYLYPYYSDLDNFKMLTGNRFDEEYFRQLWLGNYTAHGDIEKQPLAKFMQDMWEQACGVIGRKKP